MAKRCIPCLDPEARRLLQEAFPGETAMLAKIADCKGDTIIEMCGTGGKRSAYQEFVSQCMKSKNLKGLDPTAMKDCARQWREKKG